MAYNAPHAPLQAKKEDLLRYGFDESKPLFPHQGAYGDSGRGNTKRQTYAAMVTCMDKGIGQILKTLKNLHIEKNTLVLFFSDNGAEKSEGGSSGILRGKKFQEWSGGVRAPAIIRWPGRLKVPHTTDQIIGYVDVMPTLLSVAGLQDKPKKPFDGINVMPMLENRKTSIDRHFYLGHGAIIHSPWKLVQTHSGNPQMKEEEDVLFNILKDSTEQNDVKAEQPEIYNQLKKSIKPFENIKSAQQVPPYGEGRKGFVAPKDWLIKK